MERQLRRTGGFLVGGGDTPSPTPPARTLVASIWADQECTVAPSGTPTKVYVKLERGFGLNECTLWKQDNNNLLILLTPTTEYPDDDYSISWYVDINNQFDGPFTQGVYEIFGSGDIDVSSFATKFYSDGTYE